MYVYATQVFVAIMQYKIIIITILGLLDLILRLN